MLEVCFFSVFYVLMPLYAILGHGIIEKEKISSNLVHYPYINNKIMKELKKKEMYWIE